MRLKILGFLPLWDHHKSFYFAMSSRVLSTAVGVFVLFALLGLSNADDKPIPNCSSIMTVSLVGALDRLYSLYPDTN